MSGPNENLKSVETGIFSVLAFFGLYEVPVTEEKIFELLYKSNASRKDVSEVLEALVKQKKVYYEKNLYALHPWKDLIHEIHVREIKKREKKVERFLWLLGLIPFVRMMAIINSLSIGNSREDSDIDFFVITAPGTLYFVRTVIIIILRTLGLYKTHTQVSERFCFGFYVTVTSVDLHTILLAPEDPYTAFWLASMRPLFGKKQYLNLIRHNQWIFNYLPNFTPTQHLYGLIKKPITWWLRPILEIIFLVPVIMLEPVLRYIHIRHTFKLPENHWPTSTTVANAQMLKLHALDRRERIRADFYTQIENIT